MMPSPIPANPPRTLLLATDLSARTDRALARAIQLARQWDARLLAVSVDPGGDADTIKDDLLEIPQWANPVTPATHAQRILARHLDESGIVHDIQIASGNPGKVILQLARDNDCGMIITGIARNEAFRPLQLGSTTHALVQKADIPLLVVHRPTHSSYRQIAVASDFSAASTHALQAAWSLFGTPLKLSLLHGADAPRTGLFDQQASRAETARQLRAAAMADAREQIRQAGLPQDIQDRIDLVVEAIEPARLVQLFVDAHDTELLLLGRHGRNALHTLLVGSVAGRILETVRTDLLLLPAENH